MVIRYCDKCGLRVRQADLDAGQARLVDETRTLCPSCNPPAGHRSPAQGMTRVVPARGPSVPNLPSARRDSSRRSTSVAPLTGPSQRDFPRSSSKPMLIIGGVAGAVILLAVLALMAGLGDRSPSRATPPNPSHPVEPTQTAAATVALPELPAAPPSVPASAPASAKVEEAGPVKATPAYDPRASVAAGRLAEAKDYREKTPQDAWGYKDRLVAISQGYARTPAAEEATRLLAEWKEPAVDLKIPSPSAYWPFDEGTGTTVRDASGQGHDGTLVGSAEWVPGRKGQALHFSKNQYVLINQSEALELGASDFTIAAWVRTTQGGTVLCKLKPDGKWMPNGKSFHIRKNGLAMEGGWVGVVQGSTAVNDGQWHHVAVGFHQSSKNVYLYVDGQRTGDGPLQLAADPEGAVIRIGGGHPADGVGEIDELLVFRQCLFLGHIRRLMEKGVGDTLLSVPVATAHPSRPVTPAVPPAPEKTTPVPARGGETENAQHVEGSSPSVSAETKVAPHCAVYEPFDYPLDQPLEGKGGTSDLGFEGPWHRGAPIVSKKMAWDGLPTIGNCVAATGNYDAYRLLSKSALLDAGLLDDGAVLWLSFLISVEEANLTNVDMNLAFADQPFTFYELKKYPQRMDLEKGGSGIGVGYDCRQHAIQACVWTGGVRQPAEASNRKFDMGPNALALVVAKITWGHEGQADTIEVYAPDRNLDPGPVVSKATAVLDQKGFAHLGLQLKEPHTHVDEIRMGATYADVTSDTLAKMLHGLKVDEVVHAVETDGFRLSLGILRHLAERFDANKVEAKKLATVGDSIAVSSWFDASVRKALPPADGYAFAGQMGLASSTATISSIGRSLPRELPRQKAEVVRVCIGITDLARNLPNGDPRSELRSLVDAVLAAGAIPVLHTLPVKTIEVPKDKEQRDAADRATKDFYAWSETVAKFNSAIVDVATEKRVPLLDAWHIVNEGQDAHQKYFDARGVLRREGYEAINEAFLKLYRILERGIAGREPRQ